MATTAIVLQTLLLSFENVLFFAQLSKPQRFACRPCWRHSEGARDLLVDGHDFARAWLDSLPLRGLKQLVESVSLTRYCSCCLRKAVVVCALVASAVLVYKHESTLISYSYITKPRLPCSICWAAVTLYWVIAAFASRLLLFCRMPYASLHSTPIIKECIQFISRSSQTLMRSCAWWIVVHCQIRL